jgi:hypothetical protein
MNIIVKVNQFSKENHPILHKRIFYSPVITVIVYGDKKRLSDRFQTASSDHLYPDQKYFGAVAPDDT